MFDGLPFDILALAALAIFLGFRLRSVLGKRTGFEQDYTRDPEAVEKISRPEESVQEEESPTEKIMDGEGIAALQNADPNFSEKDFIKGASSAYGMILTAYAAGDIDALKPLLSYEMNTSFADDIRAREKATETLSIELISLDKAEVISAKLINGLGVITIEFQSQQQRLLKDEAHELIEGDAETTETFIERWTFERDLSSSDPNWLLAEAETVES